MTSTPPVLPVTDLNGQPFSKDLSPFTQDFKRHTSAVTPPPGHFLLPYSALVSPGDQLYSVSTYLGAPGWRVACSSIDKPVGEFMTGDGSSHIRAYCRAMTRDTTTFVTMSEYASRPIVAPKVEALPGDLAPYCPRFSTPPDPGAGRFLLPKGVVLRKDDRVILSNGQSMTTACRPGDCVGEPHTRESYSRAISDDPTLYGAMVKEALKAQTPTLFARTEELTTQVASLKAELDRLRDAHRPIQAGDWVVCINGSPPLGGCDKTPVVLNHLYQVERVRGSTGYDLVGLPDDTHVWNPMRFRRATPTEVEEHQTKVATELASKQVTITVDGVDYVSDYRGGAVLFGCAKINNNLIRRAHELLQHAPQMPVAEGDSWGNRNIEGVLIGKGLFLKADLAKLVSNLIN